MSNRFENQKDRANAILIAVISSLLTLGGVFTSSAASWITSAQNTRSSEKLSCISRLDKQEEYTRLKSDALITSLTMVATASTAPDYETKKTEYVEDFAKAAYSLMLLNDSDLGKSSGELADYMTLSILNYKHVEKPLFIKEEYEKKVATWKTNFYKFMEQLNTDRKNC